MNTWCRGQDDLLLVDPERAELGSSCRKHQKSERKENDKKEQDRENDGDKYYCGRYLIPFQLHPL